MFSIEEKNCRVRTRGRLASHEAKKNFFSQILGGETSQLNPT